MPEVKVTININKAEVMADIAEIKAELNEVGALIESIVEKASQLVDMVKRNESADQE